MANPYSLITKEKLDAVIMNDLGKDWKLQSFQIKDFTSKGDHYLSSVTGIACKSIFKEFEKLTYYVAKLNPEREPGMMDAMIIFNFESEIGFLTDVAIKLNTILRDINHPVIKLTNFFYYDIQRAKEIIIMNDLRPEGYEMPKNREGMGFDYANLTVKELARLHASSAIFKKNLKNQSVLQCFPFLTDKWLQKPYESRVMFKMLMTSNIEAAIYLTQHIKGYDKQCTYLKELKDHGIETYIELLESGSENVKVICHGDCWNNNLMFRHDEEGIPTSVAFLDLQLCRYSSFALDLNYFFYTSLAIEVRNNRYGDLLSTYYHEFAKIIKAAGIPLPFSEKEFRDEVHNTTLYGILNGLNILPLSMIEVEDAKDFKALNEENKEEFMEGFSNSILKLTNRCPIFKSRFLALLDDIVVKVLVD